MSDHLFWLIEKRFRRLKPQLPDKVRGVARLDDRRVISGIGHVLKSGGRWVDAPAEYGPRKTLYNRFGRWTEKGIWQCIFVALADAVGPTSQTLIDSSAVRAQRCAAGGKGGSRIRLSGVREVVERRKSMQLQTASAAPSASF